MIDAPDAPLGFAALPEPLRARIKAELAPGERLLWADKPEPDHAQGPKRSRASSWVWLGGWITVGGFSVAATFGFTWIGFDVLIGVPLLVLFAAGIISVLMLTHLVAGYAKEGSWQQRTRFSLYALTDRRVMAWRPVAGSNALELQQFVGPEWLKKLPRRENPDGSGDMYLDFDHKQIRGIFGVAHIRQIDEIVREVLAHPATKNPVQPPYAPDESEEPF